MPLEKSTTAGVVNQSEAYEQVMNAIFEVRHKVWTYIEKIQIVQN